MKIQCNNCGYPINNDAKFCPHCGSPVNRQSSLEEDNRMDIDTQTDSGSQTDGGTQEEKKPTLVVLLSVVCLCMLGIIIFLLMSGKRGNGANGEASNQTATVTEAEEAKSEDEAEETSSEAEEAATEAEVPASESAETAPAAETVPAAEEESAPAAEAEPSPAEVTHTAPAPEIVYDTLTANTTPGEIVTFGSYEQDNIPENGMEALEWRVLEKSGDYYLLITEKAIDSLPYNDEWTETTWEICSLREWLNSDFLSKAFSADQRSRIIKGYDPIGVGVPNDKVVILGTEELEYYFDSDAARQAQPTAYAAARGAFTHTNGCTWYWVREAGNDPHYAMYVNCLGDILHNGMLVFGNSFGIRPAIWVQPGNN